VIFSVALMGDSGYEIIRNGRTAWPFFFYFRPGRQ